MNIDEFNEDFLDLIETYEDIGIEEMDFLTEILEAGGIE